MIDTEDEKTFVYSGKEWVLTGRTATKPIFHKRKLNEKVGTMTMVEIAPAESIARSDPAFFQWVDPRELFYIQEAAQLDVEALKKNNQKVSDDRND